MAASGSLAWPRNADVGRLPPVDHHIWGRHGIMHGMALDARGRRCVRDLRYNTRSARTFGKHGLQVGDWLPSLYVAYLRGAHGLHQGGIYGTVAEGAYSIVVSRCFSGLDEDNGDTIWYC